MPLNLTPLIIAESSAAAVLFLLHSIRLFYNNVKLLNSAPKATRRRFATPVIEL